MNEATSNGEGTSRSELGVLGREALRRRILGTPPLLADWLDLDQQLQPNGVDLTLREVGSYADRGVVARDNAHRLLPTIHPLPFASDGFLDLRPGPYQIVFNEVVDIPRDLMALGRPRSTLGRCGVSIHSAVWDAGYRGRSTSLLVVINPAGFRVERNARLLQLVFFPLGESVAEGYRGAYQGENLTTPLDDVPSS